MTDTLTDTMEMASTEAFFSQPVVESDREVAGAIHAEILRQQHQIELIASENIVSRAVLEAQGSPLTNKYAEGYPGRRYYGGCEHVDVVEQLAIDRAKELFGAAYANVQPSSGSQANQGVFLALLKPGDKILGMSLDAGGHLTHGARPNMSGKWFEAHAYGVDKDTALIDYDALRKQAHEVKPALIVAGGSAYPREIDFAEFRKIADEVGAYLLVDMTSAFAFARSSISRCSRSLFSCSARRRSRSSMRAFSSASRAATSSASRAFAACSAFSRRSISAF